MFAHHYYVSITPKISIFGKRNSNIDEESLYVVVDTFRFSTTVTVALENEDISRVNTQETYEELLEYDIPSGGDHTPDSVVENYPSAFHERDFDQETVGLTSDNGATAVHHILKNGGNKVVLGCPRNFLAVSEYAKSQESRIVIFPANAHEAPVIEDYVGSVLILEAIRGREYSESDISDIESRLLQSLERSHDDLEVAEFCCRTNRTQIVPYTENGVFRDISDEI